MMLPNWLVHVEDKGVRFSPQLPGLFQSLAQEITPGKKVVKTPRSILIQEEKNPRNYVPAIALGLPNNARSTEDTIFAYLGDGNYHRHLDLFQIRNEKIIKIPPLLGLQRFPLLVLKGDKIYLLEGEKSYSLEGIAFSGPQWTPDAIPDLVGGDILISFEGTQHLSGGEKALPEIIGSIRSNGDGTVSVHTRGLYGVIHDQVTSRILLLTAAPWFVPSFVHPTGPGGEGATVDKINVSSMATGKSPKGPSPENLNNFPPKESTVASEPSLPPIPNGKFFEIMNGAVLEGGKSGMAAVLADKVAFKILEATGLDKSLPDTLTREGSVGRHILVIAIVYAVAFGMGYVPHEYSANVQRVMILAAKGASTQFTAKFAKEIAELVEGLAGMIAVDKFGRQYHSSAEAEPLSNK